MLDTELVHGLFEASPDGLVVTDEAGRIVAFSQQAEKQFGYSSEEVIGQLIEILVPDTGKWEHVELRTEYTRSPHSREMGLGQQLAGRRKNGSEFPAEISLGPVRTSKGLFIVASVRDVTERLRTDQALAEAEERFRLSFEEAPIGMALVAIDGHLLRVNHAFSEIVGYTPDELLELTFQEITHPDDLDIDVNLAAQVALGEIPHYQLAKRYIRKNGSIVDIMLSVSIVRSKEGSPLYFIAQVEDISERKRAEEALRRSEAQFRELIERMPDGVLIHWDEIVVYANAAIAEKLRYQETTDLIGLQLPELLHADDMPPVRKRIQDLKATGRPTKPRELHLLARDGGLISFESVGFIMEFDGRPGIITLLRDLTERTRAEEALRASESRYRELYDNASDGIFITDPEGRYTLVNAAASHLLGWSKEELEGKSIADLLSPEDLPRLQAVRRELMTPGAVSVAEWRLHRKDGSFVPVEVSARSLPDGRVQAFVRDITERRRAAEALEESEAQLKRAQRMAHLGSWDWDLRTNRMYRSDEIYSIFGVEPAPELEAPLSLARFLPRGEFERIEERLSSAIQKGGSFRFEYPIFRPDGRERVLLTQGEVVTRRGVPVRVIGTTLDITERKQAERAREDALRRLRTIIDACPVGIIIFEGAEGERIEANRYAVEMSGRPMDETRGREQFIGELLSPAGQPLTIDQFPASRALMGERIEKDELILRRPGRPDVPVIANATPLRDAEGHVTSAVLGFADVSSLKDLERLRAEWNSVIAHDLRQPLTTITLHAELAARLAAEAAPQAVVQITQIKTHAGRMMRMIRDLMDLSRLDAHQLPLELRSTDIVAIARDCAATFTQEAPDRTWFVNAGEEIPLVMADGDRIRQVLENLLTNAMKYGYAGKPVEIRIERANDQVRVAVLNYGDGIPVGEMPHLFQRFQRTSSARERSIKGIGLGLYITKALVEAHGGQITVESIPHEITTFRFTVPVAAPSPKR